MQLSPLYLTAATIFPCPKCPRKTADNFNLKFYQADGCSLQVSINTQLKKYEKKFYGQCQV